MPAPTLPSHVLVQLPQDLSRIGGIYTTYEKERWLTVRMSAVELEIAQQAAKHCEVTRGMFARWITLSAARQVNDIMAGRKTPDGRTVR